jgi:hypothetical protein
MFAICWRIWAGEEQVELSPQGAGQGLELEASASWKASRSHPPCQRPDSEGIVGLMRLEPIGDQGVMARFDDETRAVCWPGQFAGPLRRGCWMLFRLIRPSPCVATSTLLSAVQAMAWLQRCRTGGRQPCENAPRFPCVTSLGPEPQRR